ncbi:MAG TPA: hypothetical protein VKX16_16320 [Chloroflexota bacterium]|nr:hypothetical protein [Chloroflexota bacterium]
MLATMLLAASPLTVGGAGVKELNPTSSAAAQAGDRHASEAVAAMKQVRTVESRGSFGPPGLSTTFNGVCTMREPRAFMSLRSGRNLWQIIFIGKPRKDWERHRTPSTRWGPWQAQSTGPGDFAFPLLLPLACPRISLRDWRVRATLHFQDVGGTPGGGTPAWHLHASAPDSRQSFDWYVDPATHRLLRRRYTQYTPKGSAGYVEDVAYFAFNAVATVNPPPAPEPRPTPTHHSSSGLAYGPYPS